MIFLGRPENGDYGDCGACGGDVVFVICVRGYHWKYSRPVDGDDDDNDDDEDDNDCDCDGVLV
jgi:hypothetical protein